MDEHPDLVEDKVRKEGQITGQKDGRSVNIIGRIMKKFCRIIILCLLVNFAAGWASATPKYKSIGPFSLETRTERPSFIPIFGLKAFDQGKLIYLALNLEDRKAMIMLDLVTMKEVIITAPEPPPQKPGNEGAFVPEEPLWYEPAYGTAGMVLRSGNRIRGDALVLMWNPQTGKVLRVLTLAEGKGAYYNSAKFIGYSPERNEAFVEIVQSIKGKEETWVLGITDQIRRIGNIAVRTRFGTKGPYYDNTHLRSFHMEYGEYENSGAMGHMVDLISGEVKSYPMGAAEYGFEFDPDGKTAYAYAAKSGELKKFDLATGKIIKTAKHGRLGHVLGFVAPGKLVLMLNSELLFVNPATLQEYDGILTNEFHKTGSTHVEGSLILPNRIIARIFRDMYVLDLSGNIAETVNPSPAPAVVTPVEQEKPLGKFFEAKDKRHFATVDKDPKDNRWMVRYCDYRGRVMWTKKPCCNRMPGGIPPFVFSEDGSLVAMYGEGEGDCMRRGASSCFGVRLFDFNGNQKYFARGASHVALSPNGLYAVWMNGKEAYLLRTGSKTPKLLAKPEAGNIPVAVSDTGKVSYSFVEPNK